MISPVSQLGANSPKAAPTAGGSNADIFLSLLTQEFQMSNGLLDPSLTGLNAEPAKSADPGNADPNVTQAATPTANNAVPLKKNADKEKAQPDKDNPAATVPAVPGQGLPIVPVIVQPPVEVVPNKNGTQVESSADNKINQASDASAALPAAGPGTFLQVNSGDKPAQNAQRKDGGSEPIKSEDTAADDKATDSVDTDSSSKNVQANTSQANALTESVKSEVKAVAKTALDVATPAVKHFEAPNSKDKQVAPPSDANPQLASVATTNPPANSDPSAITANAAVLNPAANNPSVANNPLADTKHLIDKNNADATGQVSSPTDDKSKDPAATVKTTQHKDDGQLNQQDGQQAPVQNYGDQQTNAAGNSAFHAAVAQQVHATPTANGIESHSQVKVQAPSMQGGNLQSDLRVNMGPVHDSVLPVSSGPLQSAKLVERLGQSELRVGVQMGDMGGVDIRTSMAHNQLTAEISVEHSELGHMLAANLPSLQNRLSEHQIQTANIVFQNQTNSNFSGADQRNKQGNPQPAVPIERIPYSGTENVTRASISAIESGEMIAGLDIHI